MRAVIDALALDGVTLVGWSLAGPVVLDYWSRFGADRVGALVLVDTTPQPFSSEAWNAHRMHGHDTDQMDYTGVLPTITCPTTVVAADSPIFPTGTRQGRWVASPVPGSMFLGSEAGGHVPFYADADVFNAAITSTGRGLRGT